MLFSRKKLEIPAKAGALPGRPDPIRTAATHFVNGRALVTPYPEGMEPILFGMGCFWGAERKYWQAGGGRLCHRGRLFRRLDAQSDL